ncbi:hypothetical protein MRX96_032427 [Rhipicephalus microplus]
MDGVADPDGHWTDSFGSGGRVCDGCYKNGVDTRQQIDDIFFFFFAVKLVDAAESLDTVAVVTRGFERSLFLQPMKEYGTNSVVVGQGTRVAEESRKEEPPLAV